MSAQPYSIHTDVKFPPLQLIDVGKLQESTREQWFNQTLCQVNDCVVRLGVLQGEPCRKACSIARGRRCARSSS